NAAHARLMYLLSLRDALPIYYQENLPKRNLEQRQVPVLVRLDEAARGDLDTLKRLPVPGARGPVALENVATLEHGSGPVEIARLDRKSTRLNSSHVKISYAVF